MAETDVKKVYFISKQETSDLATANYRTYTAEFEADKVNEIYVGNSSVKGIYIGNTPVKAVYVGNTKVYG